MPSEPYRQPVLGAEMVCPECGEPFAKSKPKQTFCTPAHKDAFYNLQSKRGRVIMPLLVAAAMRRYGGADPEMCTYARREADALISGWLVMDRREGRRPDLVVGRKREMEWRAVDLA